MKSRNPTNAKSHQCKIPPTQLVDRSYLAYRGRHELRPANPTNALVDRSYLAYRGRHELRPANPTNAVGGLFIPSLQRTTRASSGKSHQRSWWIVHTQPTERKKRRNEIRVTRLGMNNPPTALVGL